MDFSHIRITFNKTELTTIKKTSTNLEELRNYFTSQTSK